ncbi:hypothetical protein PLEOSDRAFT_1102291 [Pleurotus ostreatus PC15]|uniref:Uncharacterized protein n=1 Tax=Pleurotus ostreatus (strain PC15) TaxID=1137138 RepID=A0A067P4L8_PLEO1|nr:hypothetical protein PLEOSDRAFT_1102291 [Pleurotus ostreatus PC15]
MSSSNVVDVEALGAETAKSGSAWASTRKNERVVAQQTYAHDPKYKKYVQQVEKCLNSFDNVHEWADCIAFLKQLLKTFQSYMQFKEIPKKLIVAKRLSQCLNPALPTGVHQRALDVYAHILAVLGSEGLKRDLALWSSGLFPFFEYAATSVKPTLLNLYDTHYMPLQGGLRPIMKSLILALLPGLEEETGEFFEKVLGLLDKLSGTVSHSFFFQNIWLIMLTTPSARGTSLNFLGRRLPRLNADEDITAIVGRDIGLMIRAFSAALEDDNLLVRRGALDLLLQSMRVDSVAVQRARAEDRTILMRAATGVVLRRDLSLNRRLYTWLLGPDDKSDHQIEYLKKHALELLKDTLKEEMFAPSADYLESRPFKIFISLLDKWEVGAALTEVLVYDAFRAVKSLIQAGGDAGEDMTMTASTLYEAVEPQIIWKHLLTHVFGELTGDGAQTEAVRMVSFIVEIFSQDDEIQNIHLPIVFGAVMDVLLIELEANPSKACTPATSEAFKLQEKILRQIPHVALMKRPELTASLQAETSVQRPYLFACSFYSIAPKRECENPTRSFDNPFITAFENLTMLTEICAHDLLKDENRLQQIRECFAQLLLLVDRLVGRLSTTVTVAWVPSRWLAIILETLEQEPSSFTVVDRVVSLAVALHQMKGLEPRLSLDHRATMSKMVTKLLRYLGPTYTAYHARAVSLLWALEASTTRSHVEAIVAQTMATTNPSDLQGAYDAFGVLWRLTEDHLLPGFKFKVPMMIVLDGLRNDDPNVRRIGETWMRCSLKSYQRVLDSLLYDLTNPLIRRVQTSHKLRGRELQGFYYEKTFDQRYVSHLLETLLSVVRFGGQGFVRTARVTQIKRSLHPSLAKRTESGLSVSSETPYLDALMELLLRFIQSEPKEVLAVEMSPFNSVIQSTCIDILQTIIPRGELDMQIIESLEAAIVAKLYFLVHTGRLDIQNKLLHLLHSVLSISVAHSSGKPRIEDESGTPDPAQPPPAKAFAANALLAQTMMDGITTATNRHVLQHWLDFILMAIPQFQPALQAVVAPLNECICKQLLVCLADVQSAASAGGTTVDALSNSSDAEFVMLLNGMERLVLLSLAYTSEPSSSEDDDNVNEKPVTEGTGLLGYVSGVFGSDNSPTAPEEQLTARSPGYRSLHEAVRVLYAMWEAMAWTQPTTRSSKDDSLSLIFNRSRLRCRRVLEHFFRAQSAEVFESIIECWSKQSTAAAFELIDALLSSAQTAVHMVCESISMRMSGVTERSKKQAINPNLSDTILFQFLEQYMQRLEGPIAVQVWPRFLQLAKEVLGSARDFRAQTYPTLRSLVVLADKVTQTAAMEDKRIRKDLQDTFSKLLDVCVVWVGRSFDQGSWIRRTTRDALGTNGRDSPAPRDAKTDEKLDASIASLPETPRLTITATAEAVIQITEYIANAALPHARRLLVDNDKILVACNNIAYYIISPAMKGKIRPMDVDQNIVKIVFEMSRLPAALKAWRPPVSELLNDNRLFNCHSDIASKWVPIVKALFDADKSALSELLAKVATSPSANIFTNREYEMLVRSLNLRRLSFVLYAGDKNHFLTSLPTIIEKLADILRNVTAPNVQSEVFLCVRVLLCRLSAHNLTSFWPVVLTELYRIFEQVMTSLPSDGSEELQLILAACKCLDLLIALQTEEFQIQQWIFITDTVDAIYRPDDYFPEAMMDQLADLAGSLPLADSREATNRNGSADPDLQPPTATGQKPLRRPLLNSLRQIDSIRDLIPFFSSVSIASYESVYNSGGNVDWEAVERGLLDDMFDGRT